MRYFLLVAGLLSIVVPAVAMDLDSAQRVPSLRVHNSTAERTISLTAAVAEYQLAYDSDPEWYFPSMDSIGAEWAVRFTPPQACSLSYFELTTYDDPWASGPVALIIYTGDSASGPGSAIIAPATFTAFGDASRQRVDLDPPLDVGGGDFFISIKVIDANSPHVTGDGDGGTGRTWYRGPTQTWDWVEDVDMNMRAYVILYGEDVVPPVILHYPDHAAFISDGQTAIAAAVSDGSGVQSVNLHYSTNMGYSYQSVPMLLSQGLYRATIPAQLPSSVVQYYIEAVDNAAQHNKAAEPSGGAESPYVYTTHSGGQLKYDDGWPASFWIVSEVAGNGNAFAVLFTPIMYPITIKQLRVYVSETTPFNLSVHTAGTPEPGSVLAGPFTVSSTEAPGWAEVTIPESTQPVITAGHFFVVLEWQPSTPTTPGVAADTMNVDGRSMTYDNATGWVTWPLSDWMIRAVYSSPVGIVETESGTHPDRFELAQNYPNPFNPRTTIEYAMPEPGPVCLSIYNALGQKVRHFNLGIRGAGNHRFDWDGCDEKGQPAPSGIYYYRLTAGGQTQTRKMVLVK